MSQNQDNVFDNFMGFSYPANGEYRLGDNVDWYWSHGDNKIELVDSTNWPSSDVITVTDGTWIGDDPNNQPYIGDVPGYGFGSDPNTGLGTVGNNPYITVQPHTYQSGTTFSLTYNKNDKYAVFELPREDMPTAVFVCGRMLTLGILGTDVEVAYTGDKLVFEPGAISAISMGGRITVSVEYDDEIYHYNIGQGGMVEYLPNSSTLVTTLVSTIKRKR